MTKRSSQQQIPAEVFLVASGNQAVLATGNLAGSGNALNIADGKLGAVCKDPHSTVRATGAMLQVGDAYTDVTTIEIVQGTPNSANILNVHPMGVGHKAVVRSPYLDAKEVQTVACAKFAPARNGAVLIQDVSGSATGTTYTFQFDMEGVRMDLVQGDLFEHALFTVTTPATAPTDEQDFLLQNVANDAFMLSAVGRGSAPYIMFGIDLAGGSGTALSAIQAGTAVDYITVDGVTYNYTFTTEDIATFQAAVAATDLVAASTIEVIDVTTAGASATIDALLIMTLPEPTTYASDYIPEVRYGIRNVGFNGELVHTVTDAATAFEGFGYGRQVSLAFNKRARLQQFSMQNEYITMQPFVQAPTYVDESLNYSVTTITASTVFPSLNDDTVHAKKIVVALPCAISNPTAAASGTYTVATTASTTVTGLNAGIGAWIKSAHDVFGHVTYAGASTAAAPFA